MTEKKKFKGTRVQRFFVIFLGLLLGVLLFRLLGFLTNDIGSLRGPEFFKVQAKYVAPELAQKQKLLQESLDGVRQNARNRQKQQDILKEGVKNLQDTINQLLSIQKQNIERGRDLSTEQQQIFAESQALFLENQKQYQALNKEVAELTEQQHQLEKELTSVSKTIDGQRASARQEYDGLISRHRFKVAALKLAIMIPIFLVSAWFFIKKRSGTCWPIVYAAFIAAFVRISLVVHEYFPKKYFKYIALLVIIGIVLRLLVYLLKRIVSPREDLIVKQYQEAYDKGTCPICNKPIRIGPLRYAVGGKRAGLVLAGQGIDLAKQEIYICPSCGAQLYEKCDKCGDIRHSLLPFCEHCGNEKANWS